MQGQKGASCRLRKVKQTHLGFLVGLELLERKDLELLALDGILELELAVERFVVLRLRRGAGYGLRAGEPCQQRMEGQLDERGNAHVAGPPRAC